MSLLKKFFAGMGIFTLVCFMSGQVFASEIDILVQKLVDKGVLTNGEAQQILTETKEEVRKEIAKGESESLPKWIQNMKLSGDLRLRYQHDDTDDDSTSGRNRARLRYRLGVMSKVNDKLEVGAGIASGSSDPRSTNQTFQDTFSTKGINLDYAYATYKPTPWLTMSGGKMIRKNILWEPTDLLWDGDINPEGAAFLLSKNLGGISLFMNNGFFVIDESSSQSSEPWMMYAQPGFKAKLADGIDLTGAVTVYSIDSQNYDIDSSSNTNSMNGALHKYKYDSISPAVEIGITEPLGGMVPYLGVFGEYVNAFDPDDDNTGYALGFKFGDKKVSDKNQWQLKYIYRKLEKDAFLDALPDSDAYDGETNVKGSEVVFEYGLAKNVIFGLDYYYMQPIKTIGSQVKEENQHVIQADVLFKF